jgi:hypothetical protein
MARASHLAFGPVQLHCIFQECRSAGAPEERSLVTDVELGLDSLGALTERWRSHYLSVDAANESAAKRVADFLAEQEANGILIYETGHSS